jgi:hypothetical protein
MDKLLALAGVFAIVSASGCAPVALTKADIDGRVVCNQDAMDQVERHARRNTVSVFWINCPQATLRVI